MTCTETYREYGRPAAEPIVCHREVDETGRHRGNHQGWQHHEAGSLPGLFKGDPPTVWEAWDSLWTWDESGAHGTGRGGVGAGCMSCREGRHDPAGHALIVCTQCGVLHDPQAYRDDAERALAPAGSCFSCQLWWVRAEVYAGRLSERAGERFVRPHGDELAGHPRLYHWSHTHGAFGGTRYVVEWDDGMTVGPDDTLWDSGRIPWWLDDAFPPNGRVDRGERVRQDSPRHRKLGLPEPLAWPAYTTHP